MLIIGIDPGKQGACVRYDTLEAQSRRLFFYNLPLRDGQWCPWMMNDLVTRWSAIGIDKVIIEECQSFPGISAHANAAVMEAYGMWRAAIARCFNQNQVHIVSSRIWKPAMGLTVAIVKAGKKATAAEKKAAYLARKARSIAVAKQEFGLSFTTDKGRGLDGEAEASLLALYGARLTI